MIKIKEPEISGVFPTPVYISNLDRPFTKEEMKVFGKHSKTQVINSGNTTSKNNYILHEPGLETLKDELTAHVTEYVKRIHLPKYPMNPYITQSWTNYTRTNQNHHSHQHPNSFISGVLYISADEKFDKITLHRNGYSQIKPVPTEWNWYNSDSWFYTVKTGMIIMFPSGTTHNVETKAGKETRISLAFNTFFTGTMGESAQLTELILK